MSYWENNKYVYNEMVSEERMNDHVGVRNPLFANIFWRLVMLIVSTLIALFVQSMSEGGVDIATIIQLAPLEKYSYEGFQRVRGIPAGDRC